MLVFLLPIHSLSYPFTLSPSPSPDQRNTFIDPDEVVIPVYPVEDEEEQAFQEKKNNEIPITLWMCEFHGSVKWDSSGFLWE